MRSVWAVLSVCACVAVACAAADDAPVVSLDYITVAGARTRGLEVFKGIPYAAPPVGALRWQPPQPPLARDTSVAYDASTWGTVCVGAGSNFGSDATLKESEDCLFLNIWRPAGVAAQARLPVLVYVHGGGFSAGSSNEFDPEEWLAQSHPALVFVNLNYRLGVLGFFGPAAVLAEGHGANFGLLDQEAAFLWIRKYIGFFGGNPSDVTAFGESAGAISLGLFLTTHNGQQPLFDRVLLESGSYLLHGMSEAAVEAAGTAALANGTGCGAAVATGDAAALMACLRAASAVEVQAGARGTTWFPTVDGRLFSDFPSALARRGVFSPVPAVFGTNTNEGTSFAMNYFSLQDADFAAALQRQFAYLSSANLTRALSLYPAANFATPFARMAELVGDTLFICPSEEFAQLRVKLTPHVPTYRYRFNHVSASMPPFFAAFGVAHASELAFLLNKTGSVAPAEYPLVAQMQSAWSALALTGAPSFPGFSWPLYDAVRQQALLDTVFTVETDGAYMPLHDERCAFWTQLDQEYNDGAKVN